MASKYIFSEEELAAIEEVRKRSKPDSTLCMNIFLRELSGAYPNDMILLCCDGAAWHKAGGLQFPENVGLLHAPPYTPEMNPIEQIWQEIRKRGFHNEAFASLTKVTVKADRFRHDR